MSGSPVRPVANLYTDRRGVVWVCAAGATNTNGQGRDTWGGGVPADSMNTYAIGNEIANTGTGEPYPIAQQSSVLRSTAALCTGYDIVTHHVRGHFEWAPTRKIDPSGPSQWATAGKWNMDAFRHDVDLLLAPAPPQPPPTKPEDDDMAKIAYYVLPPSNRPNDPHLVVVDASVRYRTNSDVNRADIPEIRFETATHGDQYDVLLRTVKLA